MRVARAPNHLGDAVMALPALRALAAAGPLEVQGPAWLASLVEGWAAWGPPRGLPRGTDLAVLFAPSLRAAWQARRASRRIGTPTDHRGWLLTHPVRAEVHRADTYAALARAAGASPEGAPVLELHGPGPEVPRGHIGVNPVVRDPTRAWPGFTALLGGWARDAPRPVVVYGGPGEERAVAAIAGGWPTHVGLPLPAFAAALARCAVFVSNDSGAAHFARAHGVPTVVVYGSTSPASTGPAGARAVRGPPVRCAPCYRARCPFSRECLDVPVEDVRAAVHACLSGP